MRKVLHYEHARMRALGFIRKNFRRVNLEQILLQVAVVNAQQFPRLLASNRVPSFSAWEPPVEGVVYFLWEGGLIYVGRVEALLVSFIWR